MFEPQMYANWLSYTVESTRRIITPAVAIWIFEWIDEFSLVGTRTPLLVTYYIILAGNILRVSYDGALKNYRRKFE